MHTQTTQRFGKLFRRERHPPLCRRFPPKEWKVDTDNEPLSRVLEPTEAFSFIFAQENEHTLWQKAKQKLATADFVCRLEEATHISRDNPLWQTFCPSKVKCYTSIRIIRGRRETEKGKSTLITVVVMQNIKIGAIFSFKGHQFER